MHVGHVCAWWGCVCMRVCTCGCVLCMYVHGGVCAHVCMLNIPNTNKCMTGSSLLHRAPVATITHRCIPVHHVEKTCCRLRNGLRAKHPSPVPFKLQHTSNVHRLENPRASFESRKQSKTFSSLKSHRC